MCFILKKYKQRALELVKQKIINDQKQLEILIRERDERLKAREKQSWVHFNPCFLTFINYNFYSNKVYLCLLSAK